MKVRYQYLFLLQHLPQCTLPLTQFLQKDTDCTPQFWKKKKVQQAQLKFWILTCRCLEIKEWIIFSCEMFFQNPRGLSLAKDWWIMRSSFTALKSVHKRFRKGQYKCILIKELKECNKPVSVIPIVASSIKKIAMCLNDNLVKGK